MIIIGRNRVELCKLKTSQLEKHWALVRGSQIYKVYPEGLTRMVRSRYGKEIHDEEVIIYAENSTVPHLTHGMDYSAGKVLSEIDEHKLVTYPGKTKSPWFKAIGGQSGLNKLLPFLILGAVLVYAFVFS